MYFESSDRGATRLFVSVFGGILLSLCWGALSLSLLSMIVLSVHEIIK